MPPKTSVSPEAKSVLAQIIVAKGVEATARDIDAVCEQTGLTASQIRSQLAPNRANVNRTMTQFAQSLQNAVTMFFAPVLAKCHIRANPAYMSIS